MKITLKKFVASCLVTLSILSSSNFLYADEFNSIDSLIAKRESVLLEGKRNLLYKQFKNQNEALTIFKDEHNKFLKFIKEKFNLKELSEKNWKEYYTLIRSKDFSEFKKEKIYSGKFFDIFENKYKNDVIKSKVKSLKENKSFDEYDEELTYLMPSNSEYSNKYHESNIELDKRTEEILESTNIKPLSMLRAAPTNLTNQRAAIAYAKKYATSPNKSKYYYFSRGDCANFVSQIFEAGGRK